MNAHIEKVNKNIKKKIYKYYKGEKWNKLFQLFIDHEIELEFIVDKSKNQNFVHILCKNLFLNQLSQFLEFRQYKYNSVDKRGNTGLHLALSKCLKKRQFSQILKFWDIFIQKDACIKSILNKKKESPMHILQEINKCINQYESINKKPNDDAWDDEMVQEARSEYMNDWGKYEDDYYNDYNDYESYSDWTDRIRQERYYSKNKNESYNNSKKGSTSSDTPNKYSTWFNFITENIRKIPTVHDANYHKLKQKKNNRIEFEKFKAEMSKFELKYNEQSVKMLKLSDIPKFQFKCDFSDVLQDYIDAENEHNILSIMKDELRYLKVFWHPDRFMQKYSRLIVDSAKDDIMKHVVSVSQKINSACTSIH